MPTPEVIAAAAALARDPLITKLLDPAFDSKTAPLPPRQVARPRQNVEREEIVYDGTNERIVLAKSIQSREHRRVLVRTISPDEFLVPEHPPMQRALRLMEDRALEYDGHAFRRLVADEGGLADDGYIAGLEDLAVPDDIAYVVETLRWDATRARTIRGSVPELIKALKDPKATVEEVSSKARATLRSIEGGGGRRFIRRPEELNREYKAELAARRAVGNFYPTHIPAVDNKLTEGLMPARTSMVVGLAGSGKSTLVAELVKRSALNKRRVLYGAWEMGSKSALDVMVASTARVEISRIVSGDFDDEQGARIEEAVDWLTSSIVFMDNAFWGGSTERKGRPSNERSLDTLEGYIAEAGCDLVVYDLWERCLEDLSYEGVTKALYRQQAMHERYNIHGMLVHQLKGKDVEQRADKRPTREGVKGTGAFVEVMDLIWGVHRDAQFKKVPNDSMEMINLKQRKGADFWSVRLEYDPTMGVVDGGIEVPYDPGLDSSNEFGDPASIATRPRSANARRPSRRDG